MQPVALPHAEPFRFVAGCVERSDDAGVFRWELPRQGETFGLRMFPQLLCVEAMAQAAAALHGGDGAADAESGVLASVDRVRFAGAPRPGDPLTIKIRRRKVLGPMVLLDGEVWVHHQLVAHGEIYVRRGP